MDSKKKKRGAEMNEELRIGKEKYDKNELAY